MLYGIVTVIVLAAANALGEGFLDDFNRPDGEVGNGWETWRGGDLDIKIVDNEVLIAGQQSIDWRRSGIYRSVNGETRFSFDFKADDNLNVHIQLVDAETLDTYSTYVEVYAWPGGPFSYVVSDEGTTGWPGWTKIPGSQMISGEYNNLVVEQDDTEFTLTLNGQVVGTFTNDYFTRVGEVFISADTAGGTVGSLHIDNVQIGFVDIEKAKEPTPEDGAVHPETWASLNWSPGVFAVSHNVYFSDNLADVEARVDAAFLGNQAENFCIVGFPGFAFPDGLINGTTYYWRIDEVNDADPNSPWDGDVWSFMIQPKIAFNPDPADGIGIADTTATLRLTPGLGAILHTVFFGNDYDQVNNATVGVPTKETFYNTGELEREKVYYWRVDEFDGLETYKGNIWTFTTPGAVGNPQPANGATDVPIATVLSWTAADNAVSHHVYFGLDRETVQNADTTSPEYKGSRTLGDESYDPGLLELGATYYWRVDEVYTENMVKGPVWSFTTANFLIVDDFESYNDLDTNDPESNRIFLAWLDGMDDPTNGSIVGHANPPFAEQIIVQGGYQSLYLLYDNSAAPISQILRMWEIPQDWTQMGVDTLSLWIHGSHENTAEPLQISLGDSADNVEVIVHPDPALLLSDSWQQWSIPIADFAGLNLNEITSMTITIGDEATEEGGTGTLYIDDICLY
jgi:hypothetical protein